MALKLFVLFSTSKIRVEDPDEDPECRGVYTSDEELRKGVDYWIGEKCNDLLFFQEWEVDNHLPYSWDWCYIPIGSERKRLEMGGAYVPTFNLWGTNLAGNKNITYYEKLDEP